jgi:hypothetical protein
VGLSWTYPLLTDGAIFVVRAGESPNHLVRY